jgi:NAD(P)H-hydrate epimerase
MTHATVLLKGAATLITSPDDVLYLNHYPNDGMATAGSGDVLSGMIGGLLGQRMDPFQATLLGIYLHSVAGDFAAQQFGHRSMTAADIIENISNAFKEIKVHPQSPTAVASGVTSVAGSTGATPVQTQAPIGMALSMEGRARLL